VEANVEGKAVLVMLKTNVHDRIMYKVKMDELRHLVETLGIEVKRDFVQSRRRPYAKYQIGSGKVKEIAKYIRRHEINLVVVYHNLRSSQKLNLIKAFGCDVVDRYEITLEIFDKMSSDNLSKLQIDSARLRKLAPYYKLEASLRYHNDRPFFRSSGEYGFHAQMRDITKRQARLKKEIEALVKENKQRIDKRKKLGLPTICISGYYNAGKTSVFNALTGDDKLVSDRPFTTLSSKYQRRFVDHTTTLLFIDTIGFVIDLDHNLIKSFQLNLEDMRQADLIMLLLDITDSLLTLQIKLAEGIRLLKNLDIPHKKIYVVFNKIDLPHEDFEIIKEKIGLESYGLPWFMVSAKDRTNINEMLFSLKDRIIQINEEESILTQEDLGKPESRVAEDT